MAKLSVNVNKVATLRNARGNDLPSVVGAAEKVIRFGADGITVHPRPDERHIRWSDVTDLKSTIDVELNVEGYPSSHFMDSVLKIMPAQATLVPDPPDVLTSNAGWRLAGNEERLSESLKLLNDNGIRSSLFVDPAEITMKELIAFRDMGCDRIELYTENYARSFSGAPLVAEEILGSYKKCAGLAQSMGMGVNAGHDLNLDNLSHFLKNIPQVLEVSIGHALVCDALDFGWQRTMELYRSCLDSEMLIHARPDLS